MCGGAKQQNTGEQDAQARVAAAAEKARVEAEQEYKTAEANNKSLKEKASFAQDEDMKSVRQQALLGIGEEDNKKKTAANKATLLGG